MIKNIEVKNFKSLKNVNLDLTNLNVLAGLNGAGKTGLIHSLLVLKQSFQLYDGKLNLNSVDFVEIGKGKDAFYQYGKEETLYFSLTLGNNEKLEWSFIYSSEAEILDSKNKYKYDDLIKCSLFTNNFQYLNAERIGPRVTYGANYGRVINLKQLGKYGEFAVHYLDAYGSGKIKFSKLKHPKSKSDTLLHQVDAWLGEISPGTKLNPTPIPGTELVLLDYQFETNLGEKTGSFTNRFRPTNVGFGLSYVLPVIIALLTSEENRLIIIENPEAHIHPKGQVELGRLISIAASNGAQIIIETHSDHIINGVRVSVKNKEITNENTKILFFEIDSDKEEHFSKISPIKIDEKGELSEYPKNFLDEWGNQLMNLLQ
jgi:predicted ATPase